MIIGEAPGAEEEVQGRPFVGRAGEELNELLRQAGLDRKDVYVSNPIKCRPPGNRDPLPDELGACFPYLAEEIASVKPRVIVAAGRVALKALTGRTVIKAERGKPVAPAPTVRIGDAQIIATYHPAAYLHNPNANTRTLIVEDLRMARRLAGQAKELPQHVYECLVPSTYDVTDIVRLKTALAKFKDSPMIAVDCEWTAGDDEMAWPWTTGAELFSVALSGRVDDHIASVAIGWPPPPGGIELLERVFAAKRLVFHNAMADLIWLTGLGIKARASEDTQILAYLENEDQRLNLDRLAPLYAGIKAGWKRGPWSKRPRDSVTWNDLLTYNCQDTYATLLLVEALHERMKALEPVERDNLRRAYYKLLIPALPAFVNSALTGLHLDQEATAIAIAQQKKIADDAVVKFAKAIGMQPRYAVKVIDSPTVFKRYLQQAFGLKIETTRADELDDYADEYPIVGMAQERRHARKFNGTYFEPWEELARKNDGRLHSVYRIDRTGTGRTTATLEKGGSVQLAPRELSRELITAPKKRRLISADYSQIELRMIAWLAPERTMAQFFREDIDLHTATAAYVKAWRDARLSVEEFWPKRDEWMAAVTKQERQGAKGFNFGLGFGMMEEKLVKYAKTTYGAIFTLEEAREARDGYMRLYYDIPPWHRRCQEIDLPRGWVVNPFGRYRRGLEDVTKAINTPIQSSANDLTIFAKTIINEHLEERYDPASVAMAGYLHDAILIECDEELADEVRDLVKQTMENPPLEDRLGITIPIPLKADVKIGDSWASAV